MTTPTAETVAALQAYARHLARPPLPTLVLAGNATQARFWADHEAQIPPTAWVYVGSADALHGRNTGEQPRVLVGSFRDRHDSGRILGALTVSDLRPARPGAAKW
jgi:hypothetical protein